MFSYGSPPVECQAASSDLEDTSCFQAELQLLPAPVFIVVIQQIPFHYSSNRGKYTRVPGLPQMKEDISKSTARGPITKETSWPITASWSLVHYK